MRPVIAELKRIVLAEDNANDIELTLTALRENHVANEIVVVRDGAEALDYLYKRNGYADRFGGNPALLLLDLKMPRTDGFEVLKWVRQQPELAGLRVIVLTSSSDIRDINKAYELGANSFLVKPMDFQNFVEMTRFLQGHWLQTSKAPQISRPPREQRLNPDRTPYRDSGDNRRQGG